MQEYLKVPKERIAVLIGKNGETRKEIEKTTKTKLKLTQKPETLMLTEKMQ